MNIPSSQVDWKKIQSMSKEDVHAFVLGIEEELAKLEQVDVPVEHHFSYKVYGREMRMKKDEVVVGKIHKFETLNILSAGEVSVLSIDGLMRFKAPHTFVGSPGAKRLIYAHEDSIWTVIHGTAERDLEKIENEFIAKDLSEIAPIEKEVKEALCHG